MEMFYTLVVYTFVKTHLTVHLGGGISLGYTQIKLSLKESKTTKMEIQGNTFFPEINDWCFGKTNITPPANPVTPLHRNLENNEMVLLNKC